MAGQAEWSESLMQILLFPASLSEKVCIGFAEFNGLNEGLNQWLSGKKKVLLPAKSGNLS
jgi:hypothetical protein